MKGIETLYMENSSVKLISKMNEGNILKNVVINFVNDKANLAGFDDIHKFNTGDYDYNTGKYITEYSEFLCERIVADAVITYLFTDYTFVTKIRHLTDHYCRIDDNSDQWIKYLSSNLKGKNKERYLLGLKLFSTKLTTSIQNQLLDDTQLEENICK